MGNAARAVVASCLVVCALIACEAAARAERVYDAELVKAGIVAQLTRFVEWPSTANGPRPPILDVAFLGPSRVADGLRRMRRTDMRVREVRLVEELGDAHVVFVTRAHDASLPSALAHVDARPVLVIAEGPQAAARGACFGLRDDGSRIRIEVNRRALERADLRVSYHVLRLATVVSP